MKAQSIRLLDVFALGPLMLVVASRARGIPEWQRVALALTGIGTILYNGENYLRIKRGEAGCG